MRSLFIATPGWLLMLVVAAGSLFLSQLIEVGSKHPLEAAVVAIIVGIGLRNFSLVPKTCEAGAKAFEKPLVLGIVLIGASLDFRLFVSQGVGILTVVLVTMLVGFIGTLALAKAFKLSTKLGVLLTVGTTICGGTAIAIIAPLIRAKEAEMSYAIGTIALWGLAAIFIYPSLAVILGVSDYEFGVFAGTAIHSTPQVVGAGFIFSDMAGETATAVKLVRNCFIAPVALLCVLWFRRAEALSSGMRPLETKSIRDSFPWFLFGYFIMAWLNTNGFFEPELTKVLVKSGKFLILAGMVGVGLNTRMEAFKSAGVRPAIVGFLGALIVAAASALIIGYAI